MHSNLLRLLALILSVVSLILGIYFSEDGFRDIQSFKKLERLVPSSIIGMLDGPVQVTGVAFAKPLTRTLTAPSSGEKVLYYRYLKEREETDSDGDTRWVTEIDEHNAVDFYVQDRSGKADLNAKSQISLPKWSLPDSYRKTVGNYRYTEWWVKEGEEVLIYAWADVDDVGSDIPQITLRFDKEGDYSPIISKYSSAYERGEFGFGAVWKVWGGMTLLAFSVVCLIYFFKVHRILVFLSFLTIVTSSSLAYYGINAMVSDVLSASWSLDERRLASRKEIASILSQQERYWQSWDQLGDFQSVSYQSFSEIQRERMSNIRMNLYNAREMYLYQISNFPESFVASVTGVSAPAIVPGLSEVELTESESILARFTATKVDEFWGLVSFVFGVILFTIFIWFGFRIVKNKRLIENVPTSKTLGVTYGIAEVKGRLVGDKESALKGPLSRRSCYWYRYKIDEKQGSGDDAKWVTILDETKNAEFRCQDFEGEIGIDAEGAEVITRHKEKEKSGYRKYTEWSLRPKDKIYVIGNAAIDKSEGDRLTIGKGGEKSFFLLSNYSENEVMLLKATKGIVYLFGAYSALFLSALFASGMNGSFSATDYLLSSLISPFFMLVFMVVLHYNDLVFLRERAKRNWANIQVSLKKRAVLLPRLQSVAKQYLSHEAELLEQLTALRNRLDSAMHSTQSADKFLRQEHLILDRLTVLSEDYPELKGDAVMQQVMSKLTWLENEVSLMRQGFNDSVSYYNQRIAVIPDVFVAKIFGFKKADLLSFTENAVPIVKSDSN